MSGPVLVPPRSGDQLLNTFGKVGLLVSLLSPFLQAALTWIKTHTIVVFTDGYQQQLETAIGFAAIWVVATLQMRAIKKRDANMVDTASSPSERTTL